MANLGRILIGFAVVAAVLIYIAVSVWLFQLALR